ncbi:sulfotransferase family 2 domain-containing protein [Halobacillus andaensis]|uniref:sulfotransferase family 2 domain-containing protein n=1 Tax=Halobacillus andaensis TaxID=1176239 RepID=UPI003D732C98
MIHFNKEKLDLEKLVCFLHIPKSGGKTMWNILAAQEEEILVWHGKHFKKLKKQPVFFTMLRDPVERVISTFYYIKSYERDPLHEQVKDMSFEEFLTYMKADGIGNKQYHKRDIRSIRYRTVNLATRYLSGGDPEGLKKANAHLKKYFKEVGLTERFSESLFFIKKYFGWHDIKIEHLNITQNRPKAHDIPPHIIKEIKRLNNNDIALYKQARKKFEARLSNLDEQQKIELQEWKRKAGG